MDVNLTVDSYTTFALICLATLVVSTGLCFLSICKLHKGFLHNDNCAYGQEKPYLGWLAIGVPAVIGAITSVVCLMEIADKFLILFFGEGFGKS